MNVIIEIAIIQYRLSLPRAPLEFKMLIFNTQDNTKHQKQLGN